MPKPKQARREFNADALKSTHDRAEHYRKLGAYHAACILQGKTLKHFAAFVHDNTHAGSKIRRAADIVLADLAQKGV
jgi:hypothetical protein